MPPLLRDNVQVNDRYCDSEKKKLSVLIYKLCTNFQVQALLCMLKTTQPRRHHSYSMLEYLPSMSNQD